MFNLGDRWIGLSLNSFMDDVELTEEWLFERLRINQEKKFRDPKDTHLEVRRQEAEREEKGYRRGYSFWRNPIGRTALGIAVLEPGL